MKTTKKILAALLAVMMLAMMIPFSASAAVPAGPYTATYVCNPNLLTDADKADRVGDYTFSFFKIADLNERTGEYEVISALASQTAIVNTINEGYSPDKSKTIIDACDAIYKTNSDAFGTAAKTISFTASETEKEVSLTDAGIYYTYCTAKPAKVTSVQNSLVSLPYYSNGAWVTSYDASSINLAGKVSTSSVDVTKKADKTNIGDNDSTVTYTLTASTAGSMENQLTTYAIVDTMDEGLTLKEDTIVVKIDDTSLTKGTDYTVETNYQYKDAAGATQTATFAIVLKNLNKEAFYKSKTVTVVYEADINENAKLATALPNEDGLVYGNASALNYEPGDKVNVFTYGMDVYKVNGVTNTALEGAEFTVYTDEQATKPLLTADGNEVKATTGRNGIAKFDFKFDADATYYVKETKAPANYNISDAIYTVSIDTSKEYTRVNQANGGAIKNYPVVVPQTGGMGTMIFTISGALLIACAGVLFLVVRRKKNA